MTEKKKGKDIFGALEITINGREISFAYEIFEENRPKPFLYRRPPHPPKTWSPYNGKIKHSKVRKIDPKSFKITILL